MFTHIFQVVLILILISDFVFADDDNCEKKEKPVSLRIKNYILCDYDKTVRPGTENNSETEVMIHLKLRYFSYDAHSYMLSVDAWFPMMWKDVHLSWNPDDFEDLTEIHIPSDDIWTPDVSLYNKGDLSMGPRVYDTADCMVSHTGNVICLPISQMDGLCVPDLRHWPYDSQICKLKVGSWIHRGDEINFKLPPKAVVTEGYSPNSEWLLINTSVYHDPGIMGGYDSSFPSLNYIFNIKRHSSAAVATIIVPSFVMMIMTILTIWLEPRSSDRIYITALNLTCHFLFLQHIVWEVPLNGDTVPYIILFLRDSMLLTAFTMLETVVVRSMLDTKHVSPAWLVTSFSLILNNRAGQMLLLAELNPEEAAVTAAEDDSTNLVDATSANGQKEWYWFGRIIDRLTFIAFVISYVIMLILYLP